MIIGSAQQHKAQINGNPQISCDNLSNYKSNISSKYDKLIF
jgi:hypothetical protein